MKDKFSGKSHDKVVMNALEHAKNMGCRMHVKGPGGVESVFEEGDYVTAFDGNGNVIWSYGDGKWRNKPVGEALAWAKKNFGVNAEAGEACVSTNPIVRNAMDYARSCNAQFKVGDKVWYTSKSRGGNILRRKWDIVDENGQYYFVRLSDEPNGQINKVQKSIVQRECVANAEDERKALNKKFRKGDKVKKDGRLATVIDDDDLFRDYTIEYDQGKMLQSVSEKDLVAANADPVCNAKFKRNQRVIVKGLSGMSEHGRIERVSDDDGKGNVWYEINYGLGMMGEARERDIKAENAACCNGNFHEGQKVTIHGIEPVDLKGTIVKKAPNGWWVSWGGDKTGVLPEKYLIANAEDAVCNFDPKTRGAQEVIKAIAAIPGGPSNLRRAQALEIQKRVGASDKDFDAALRFYQWDGIADVRNGEAVCNNVGDCYADATFCIERAIKNPKVAKSELSKARQDIAGSYGVMSYDNVTATDKATVGRCVAAIDKAIGNPTKENLMAARWECEKSRAAADGTSARKGLWS